MQKFHLGRAGSKYFTLCSSLECLSNNSLFWHMDNFAIRKIVASGSSKSKLQIKVNENYKPQNTLHQSGEQWENWQKVMTPFGNFIFKLIIEEWTTMTVDCFAYCKSSRCSRLKSNYLHLPIILEDVFFQYWLNEACLNVSHPQP